MSDPSKTNDRLSGKRTARRASSAASAPRGGGGPGRPKSAACTEFSADGAAWSAVNRVKAVDAILCDHCTLLRAVVEGTTDAVFVKDLRGSYLLANTAVARIVNRSLD